MNNKLSSLGCNVLKQGDDVGNEGRVEGFESPILGWKYLEDPDWKNFIPPQMGSSPKTCNNMRFITIVSKQFFMETSPSAKIPRQ